MKIFKQKWLIAMCVILITAGVVSFFGFSQDKWPESASAGTAENISGFAWSPNIGWISFNSTDCDTDGDGIFEGNGENGGPAPSGCPTSGTARNYGVTIDGATGNLSGSAWSPNVGLIYFGPDANLSDYGPTNASDAPGNPKTWGSYDPITGNITGWAKILSMGNDGWVKLRENGSYGISVNLTSGELEGWTWNGNDNGAGIGWISFNSKDCTDNSGLIDVAACGTIGAPMPGYHVSTSLESPPVIGNLTAMNWNYVQADSGNDALRANLKWEILSGSQKSYQVIVSTNPDFSSTVYNSGVINSSATRQVTLDTPINPGILNYGTAYYWKIRVWNDKDGNGIVSGWVQYDSVTDTDNDDGNPLTFTTYKHPMPDPSFTIFPEKPSLDEDVRLIDSSQIYLTGGGAVPCTEVLCDWSWSIVGQGVIIDPTSSSPTVTGLREGDKITLVIRETNTDAPGYEGSFTYDILPGFLASALPKWKEVK